MPAEQALTGAAGPATKRRKVTLACEACRNRKSRCDGTKPQCRNCSQRGERCVYRLANAQRTEVNEYIESLVTKVGELEGEIQQARDALSAAHTMQMLGQSHRAGSAANQDVLHGGDNHELRGREASIPAAADDQQIPEARPERTLLVDTLSPVDGMGGNTNGTDSPATGEKFYGVSSSMSFMKQFYNMTSRSTRTTGSSQGKAIGSTAIVDEHQTSHATPLSSYIGGSEVFTLLPRAMADYLLDLYWDRVYHIYPFVHRATFMAAYEQLWTPASGHTIPRQPRLGLGGSEHCGFSSSIFHCALNAMMVLGLQFSDLPGAQINSLSVSLTERAKSQFDLELFDDGSLYVVQTLLLLVQVFQFTTFPTRCWSTIGGACRLAQGLGLHLAEGRLQGQFKAVEIELRKRIWHSCLMLDMIVSMTLGRPAMLRYDPAVAFPIAIDDEYLDHNLPQPPGQVSNMTFFGQAAKLYTTLSKILSQVYSGNETDKPDAQRCHGSFDQLIELDTELSGFADQVPDALSWTNENVEIRQRIPVLAQQMNILRARYLHLRILLYRPSFTQFCRLNTSLTQQASSKRDANTVSQTTALATSFAQCCSIACVRSAIELIDLTERCAATKEFGAWWYSVFYIRTAAMVILLADVCGLVRESIGSSVLSSSWQKCRTALLHRLPQGALVRGCMQTLEKMHEHMLKIRTKSDHVSSGASDGTTFMNGHASSSHGEQQATPEQVPYPISLDGFDLMDGFHQYGDYFESIFNENEFNLAINDYGVSLL